MKKIFSLILALSICVSLCACGKSDEAAAVDEMILAIGEVSIDNISAVEDASRAYDLLSEKDRKSIEYYDVLIKAKDQAIKVQEEHEKAQEKLFYDELNRLTNGLIDIYESGKYVINDTITIWDNVGVDQFWMVYQSVLLLDGGMTKAELDAVFKAATGRNADLTIWAAAYGLRPKYAENSYAGSLKSEKEVNEILDLCYTFNINYKLISESMSPLAEEIKAFRNEHKDKYQSELEALNELCLEINLYVDFILEPSGSLSSYTSSNRTYQSNIERLIKTINALR